MMADELGKQAYQKMMLNEYKEAINILNSAIMKYPEDQRLYANRCYSYMQLKEFDCAMKDASHLTENFQIYPKGFFLKGEINLHLKNYVIAEKYFSKVIELIDSVDAEEKIFEAKLQQVLQKGYDIDVARKALRISYSTQEALRSLALGWITKGDDDQRSYYSLQLSEEEEKYLLKEFEKLENGDSWQCVGKTKPLKEKTKLASPKEYVDPLMDPSNSLKCPSLWIGNISKDVKDSKLKQMFAKYGNITSFFFKPEKKCAFVNYANYESASKAMMELQDHQLENLRLLIKYPDNSITVGASSKNK